MFKDRENPEQPKPRTFWDQALATFLEDYMAVDDLSSSTHQYTTAEIQNLLHEHTGEFIPKTALYESLDALGFKYTHTGNDLEWLFKKK